MLRAPRFKIALCLVWLAQRVIPGDFTVFVEHEEDSRWIPTEAMAEADILAMIKDFRSTFDKVQAP